MKKILRFFNSAKFILIFSFLLNIAFFVLMSLFLNSVFYGIVSAVITLIAFVALLRSNSQPIYKMMWLLLIFILPLFGCVLYIRSNHNYGSRVKRKNWQNITFYSKSYLPNNEDVFSNLEKTSRTSLKQSNYLSNMLNMPVYENNNTKFLANGESYFKEMFELIKKAKHYIFLEYFIYKEGTVWSKLFELLKEKAREGVEIKLLYDDFGCMDRFNDKNTFKKLANYKIEALPFNKLSLSLSGFMNYRNHRKLLIVDGNVALTGGINIGDEYANINSPYGTWKDSGIKITGDAVWSFVVMFINNWHFSTTNRLDYEKYKYTQEAKIKSREFVQPYGTSPLSNDPIARNIYLNLINSAQKSINITTPYLILDEDMVTALKLAAKSGIQVNIIFPGKPDKKTPYYLARSRFAELIKSGINIYEFTNGFIHAKEVIIDESIASIGTINMDFRSLYLHFENGVLIYNSPTISDMIKDYNSTLSSCHKLTLKDMKKRKFGEKFCGFFLKLLSPIF